MAEPATWYQAHGCLENFRSECGRVCTLARVPHSSFRCTGDVIDVLSCSSKPASDHRHLGVSASDRSVTPNKPCINTIQLAFRTARHLDDAATGISDDLLLILQAVVKH